MHAKVYNPKIEEFLEETILTDLNGRIYDLIQNYVYKINHGLFFGRNLLLEVVMWICGGLITDIIWQGYFKQDLNL